MVPFNSIEWIHGHRTMWRVRVARLSIPLNGFLADKVGRVTYGNVDDTFNSIEWIHES